MDSEAGRPQETLWRLFRDSGTGGPGVRGRAGLQLTLVKSAFGAASDLSFQKTYPAVLQHFFRLRTFDRMKSSRGLKEFQTECILQFLLSFRFWAERTKIANPNHSDFSGCRKRSAKGVRSLFPFLGLFLGCKKSAQSFLA